MTAVGPASTLVEWVEQAAVRYPNHSAVEAGDERLAYERLWETSERWSAQIVGAVPQPVRRVGLLATATLTTYIWYLAILRAGAAVVPLNPQLPLSRQQDILRAARPDLLVAPDGDVGALEGPMRELDIDELNPAAARHTSRTDTPAARPDDPAYVLFTSGSTGRPKGVPIKHSNVLPYLRHIVDRCAVATDSRLSHTFDLTFDVSVFDVFAAWGTGATLVVPQPGLRNLPVDYVNTAHLTHWCSVPSVISMARRTRRLRPGSMPGLRSSTFIGEQLTVEQAEVWADAAPCSTIENSYGPTELAVACAGYRLPSDRRRWPTTSNGSVPIGEVYPHLDAILVDETGARSECGELCVRGPQRFDGYLDPRDDEGRFLALASPPTVETPPDSRYYRTGDRVRVESGVLVHLGRLDHQVKVRGYRVELGEVEALLRRQDGVAEVVVVVLTTEDGVATLHAAYTGRTVDEGVLKKACAQHLPRYMVPDRYHHRADLPLNANLKIDRAELSRVLAQVVAGPRTS